MTEVKNGFKLPNEIVFEKILNKCKERNYEFIGFDNKENEYKNDKTYLILKCNKCGNIWKTTSYGKFIRDNRGCPNCNVFDKSINKEDVIQQIQNICKERDFTFIGFNEEYHGKTTYLHLKCNKCQAEWKTTTIANFLKKNRKSHTCGRKANFFLSDEKKLKTYKNKLKNPHIEILGFLEDEYITPTKNHLRIKCNRCNEEFTYSCSKFNQNKGNIKCKHCERNLIRNNEEAIKLIKQKCELLEYTFLGFLTKDKKYYNKDTKISLKCNKCGRIWNTTKVCTFLNRTVKCLGCINAWKLEKEIEITLKDKGIQFEMQKRFDWLKDKAKMALDFYLPKYNIAIECQGRQHFMPVSKFGGQNGYNQQHKRDILKHKLCNKNNIKILYYSDYKKIDTFLNEKIINNKEEIIKEIKKYG